MSNPKILIVDDEPDIVQMISRRLKAAGYEVSTAYDGQQALDMVRETLPQLVILDLMLPKLDGYKVCRLLKFDERFKEIPVLIFTARANAEDIQLATECGASAYLNKPFEPHILLSMVEKLLLPKAKGSAQKEVP
ncbi:MAG: response regulator [Candidatus Omnitrophica bacterium]|nr:response regulator [Candidatus Omnitrophota bacterium]